MSLKISSIRVDMPGLREVMHSPGVRSFLHEQAERVRQRTGQPEHFRVEDSESFRVARTRVYIADWKGYGLEKYHGTLSGAL